MPVDLSGELTAIATAVLAAGAIITAIFAVRAFRKQSQEVAAIERQVKDQQELAKQQAELLKVQSGQLDLQREQLDDQRQANALQSEELRESLAERARQRRIAEREQASAVNVTWWPANHVLIMHMEGQPFPNTTGCSMLIVSNTSRRRILNAASRIEPSKGNGLTLTAERTGQLETGNTAVRATMNTPAETGTVPLIRAGAQYGFLLRFDLRTHPDTRFAARFTDDENKHWQIDQDLHLQPLSNRDDW